MDAVSTLLQRSTNRVLQTVPSITTSHGFRRSLAAIEDDRRAFSKRSDFTKFRWLAFFRCLETIGRDTSNQNYDDMNTAYARLAALLFGPDYYHGVDYNFSFEHSEAAAALVHTASELKNTPRIPFASDNIESKRYFCRNLRS